MSIEFTQEEKICLFDKIKERYFDKKFGLITKVDIETLLFSEIIEHCISQGKPYDDYSLSKELGISQTRIRTLKERKELMFPHENFKWQEAFVKSIETAKYHEHDHCVKILIEDINVMNEVRHYIESKGWYDECSLNKKLLKIPLDCFIEICFLDNSHDDIFTKEAKENINKISSNNDVIKKFLENFTKEGLKEFLMSAHKEILLNVLKLIQFNGMAGIAISSLTKIIGNI